MSFTIYLVEDDKNINDLLVTYLKKEGWEVRSFTRGESAVEAIPDLPSLWILDIMLPDTDGFELLRLIKAYHQETPIIFISARDADIDRIVGLELGSDDYLAKPFLPRELILRVKRLLERVYTREQLQVQKKMTINYLSYQIDVQAREVKEGQHPIDLTAKEFDVLLFFIERIGKSIDREQLLTGVWGNDYFGSDRVVDDLIRRLRKKMTELKLETLYGYGYRLNKVN